MWLQRYRMLMVAYGIALLVGAREYFVSREAGTPIWGGQCEASAAACASIDVRDTVADDSAFWARHGELTRVVAQVNPDDPDTKFLLAMQALAEGDEEETVRRLEEALASGVKHNDHLLRSYAQYELSRGADWQRVNFAVNRWRENHPFSADPLYLQLGAGPRDEAEAALLHEELSRVPWIAGSELQSFEEDGEQGWRVALSFRPGQRVDVRQAVAAVTVLSLTEEQRARFRVRCSTLEECALEPR